MIARPTSVLFLTFPWVFKMFSNLLGRQDDIILNRNIFSFIVKSIRVHKNTLDVNSPRDVIDTMLVEIEKTTDKNSSFYEESGMRNLVNTLFDLFIAGSETTSTTLIWALLYIIREPEVQKKVQYELDAVVGPGRLPGLADRPH